MSAAKAMEPTVIPLAAITVIESAGAKEERRISGEELAQLIENHDVTSDPHLTDPEELVTRLEGLAGLVQGLASTQDTPDWISDGLFVIEQELKRAARCVQTFDPLYRTRLAEKDLRVELPAEAAR